MCGFLSAGKTCWLKWPKRAQVLRARSENMKNHFLTPQMEEAFKVSKTMLTEDIHMTTPTVIFHFKYTQICLTTK